MMEWNEMVDGGLLSSGWQWVIDPSEDVLFMREGKMECETDKRIGEVSAVTQTLYWTVVVKRGLTLKAKLLIHRSV